MVVGLSWENISLKNMEIVEDFADKFQQQQRQTLELVEDFAFFHFSFFDIFFFVF